MGPYQTQGSPMQRFEVTVDGYMPEVFEAESRDKARYKAFQQFTEAWPCTFHAFLVRSQVWPVPESRSQR